MSIIENRRRYAGWFRGVAIPALVLLACPEPVRSQDANPGESIIEDNSFLIEEAYNQEPGIIQHISNFVHEGPGSSHGFVYTLTEEWPIAGQIHQFGFTMPYVDRGGGAAGGFGDILVNYRYQLTGAGDAVAIAPRLSLILPTGDESRGQGSGVFGAQVNLPVSTRLSQAFVAHFNAGFTILPDVHGKDASGSEVSRTLSALSGGGSVIWLASARMNVHVEGLVIHVGDFGASGEVENRTEFIVNPAVRCATDLGSLQIVPGFGVPVTFTSGDAPEASLFFYLSFEHPL